MVGPLRPGAGHVLGQFADTVGTIPRSATVEVVCHGIIIWYQRAAHVEFHIYRPCHPHLFHLLVRNLTQFTIGQLFPTSVTLSSVRAYIIFVSAYVIFVRVTLVVMNAFLTKFLRLFQDIITELIVFLHKLAHPLGNSLFVTKHRFVV